VPGAAAGIGRGLAGIAYRPGDVGALVSTIRMKDLGLRGLFHFGTTGSSLPLVSQSSCRPREHTRNLFFDLFMNFA